MYKVTKMDYSKINLHLLRIYAREIGVKAPCACTKKELIKKIMDVESGKIKPCFNKVGRPVSKKLVCQIEQLKVENKDQEKSLVLFVINRLKEFLCDLEKEIKEKF